LIQNILSILGEDLDVAGFSYDDEENELDEDDIYGDFEGNSGPCLELCIYYYLSI